VEAIADALAPQEVDGFLKEVLIQHGFGIGNGKELAGLMGRISDHSVRLEVLKTNLEHRSVTADQVPDELLRQWNVSRSEVEAVIAEED
jgi:hypothetical protein